MTAAELYVCIVCTRGETRQELLATCSGCGELYHFNPTNGPGIDCGDAWIEDEEVGMQFYCNNCMSTARRADEARIEQLKALVASGGATPEVVADLMQSLGSALPGLTPGTAGGAFSGFPGMAPSMPGAPGGMALPGVPGFPGGVPASIVIDPRQQAAPADATPVRPAPPRGGTEPPPLAPRRARRGAPRRYRRIE